MVFVNLLLMAAFGIGSDEPSVIGVSGSRQLWRSESCVGTLAWVQSLELLEMSPSFLRWEWRLGCMSAADFSPDPSVACGLAPVHSYIFTLFFPFPSFLLAPDVLFTAVLMKSEPEGTCVEKSWVITLSEFSSKTLVPLTCIVFVQIPVGYKINFGNFCSVLEIISNLKKISV